MKNNRLLITGGTGFIGAHLTEDLAQKGWDVHILSKSVHRASYFNKKKLQKKFAVTIGNVCDREFLLKEVKKNKITHIIHLAAVSEVDRAFKNPFQAYVTNIMGTVSVCEITRKYSKLEGLIVASSDKAYGKNKKKGSYSEKDCLSGNHPYEVSKLSGDLISQSYVSAYQSPIVVTRCANIYGEGDHHSSRIIPSILNSILTGKVLKLRSNGQYVRDYLYVKDVVNGYSLLLNNLERSKGQTYNLGSDESFSVIDLIREVEKVTNTNIRYTIENTATNEIPYQRLNDQKIRREFDWSPVSKISSTIELLIEWKKDTDDHFTESYLQVTLK